MASQSSKSEQQAAPIRLFALTDYDAPASRFVEEAIRELAAAHSPVLSRMKRVELEGPIDSQLTTDEGVTVDLPGVQVKAPIEYSLTEIIHGNYDGLITAIDGAADVYAGTIVTHVFESIGKVTEATGLVKRASGPFSWDDALDMFEAMDWSFDKEGNPKVPTIATGTGTEIPAPEQRHHDRLAEIIDRKRKEHLAARGTRRLP
jgi:hypothetical protein